MVRKGISRGVIFCLTPQYMIQKRKSHKVLGGKIGKWEEQGQSWPPCGFFWRKTTSRTEC